MQAFSTLLLSLCIHAYAGYEIIKNGNLFSLCWMLINYSSIQMIRLYVYAYRFSELATCSIAMLLNSFSLPSSLVADQYLVAFTCYKLI